MKKLNKKASGFSLVELITVLLILTALGTVAIRSTVELGYDSRHRITQERLQQIRRAIIGDPNVIINGQPDVSGFVADMGRLPENLRELLQRYDCTTPAGAGPLTCTTPAATPWLDTPNSQFDTASGLRHGWRGPYLNTTGDPEGSDAFTDGWGRETTDDNYGWGWDDSVAGQLTITSYGRDQTAGGACGENDYNGDCSITINPFVPLDGVTFQIATPPGGATNLCARLFYRDVDGTITNVDSDESGTGAGTLVNIIEDGHAHAVSFHFDKDTTTTGFQPVDVPIGINSIGVYQDCTTTPYRSGSPIPVLMDAHFTQLPLLVW